MEGNNDNLLEELTGVLNDLKKNSEKSDANINFQSEINGILGNSDEILDIVKKNPDIHKEQ